jgi:hypothetical protein
VFAEERDARNNDSRAGRSCADDETPGVIGAIKRVYTDETDDDSAGQRVKVAETVEGLHDENACDVGKNANRSCAHN